MSYFMYKMISESIPEKVHKIATEIKEYYGEEEEEQYREIVNLYEDGKITEHNEFIIDETALYSHLRTAKRRFFDIDITDTCITVVRNLPSNRKYVVTYTPIGKEDEKND